ncbi:MAG: hypothetical protein JXA54_08830 [Candidatus Heimdallarchaeota archaeon]|nr:hypothetical protein [Candidatus Heimdallarchaeota archaeon]
MSYLLIIICCGSFIIETHSSFVPSTLVGQSFVYNVLTSNLNVTLDRKDYFVDTFQFEQQQYPAQTDVEIVVNASNYNNINYTQTIGTDSYNIKFPYLVDMAYSYVYVLTDYYSDYALDIASTIMSDYIEEGNFSSSSYGSGLLLELAYFLPPNETIWSIFQTISSNQLNTSNYDEIVFDIIVQSSYTEQNGFVYLESYINCKIYKRDYYDGKLNNGFLLIYEKSTGVLYGLHIKGTFDGKLLNRSIRCDTEFHIELADYDMPELSLYTALTPNAGIVLISFGLTICAVFTIKRKKRN